MYDIVIIGSGPAGLSASIYCKRAGKKILIIEKEYEGTGQISYSVQVDNYLGFSNISGFELGEKFREHAIRMDIEFVTGEVTRLMEENSSWNLALSDGTTYHSKAIIYATGTTNRLLFVPGEEKLIGKGVSYCAICDGAFYKDKDVAVIGGGDTAVDDALYLSEICRTVYLVHRRNTFRCAEEKVTKLKNKKNIVLVLESEVVSIHGENRVEFITCTGDNKIFVDGVFIAIGMTPISKMIEDIVALDSNGYVIAKEDGKTDKKGFFVAGDIRTKQLRQVATAISDGANAAMSAINYLS